jgi:ribosomal protein L32
MGLPGHRRTSSHKRRRASHFAIEKRMVTKDKKTGVAHLPHRVAPGAAEYNGHKIHVKGQQHKVEKLLKKSSASRATKATHEHEGHNH